MIYVTNGLRSWLPVSYGKSTQEMSDMTTAVITEDLPELHLAVGSLPTRIRQRDTEQAQKQDPFGDRDPIGTQINPDWLVDIADAYNAGILAPVTAHIITGDLSEFVTRAWSSTATLSVFPLVARNTLGDLLSLLKARTPHPNIREYDDSVVTVEARLNEEEQLFAEVGPGDQLEAVVYVRGKGSVPLQPISLAGLLNEVLVRLGRSTR